MLIPGVDFPAEFADQIHANFRRTPIMVQSKTLAIIASVIMWTDMRCAIE